MNRAVFETGFMDGWGNDSWDNLPSCRLSYSRDVTGTPAESGLVRFGWNSAGLYVLAELEDSCLVSVDRHNERLHFQTGDVFELFVKPLNDTYYWELYATQFGNKSTLFFSRERAGMKWI